MLAWPKICQSSGYIIHTRYRQPQYEAVWKTAAVEATNTDCHCTGGRTQRSQTAFSSRRSHLLPVVVLDRVLPGKYTRAYTSILTENEGYILLLLQLPNKAPLPVSVSTCLLTTPVALHDYKDHFGGGRGQHVYGQVTIKGVTLAFFLKSKKKYIGICIIYIFEKSN